jgi:uncharacterized RDD family membrane protein YckC
MTDNYYILTNGQQTGPFTLHELIQMELRVDTMVMSPQYDGWIKAADLPELFEYFEANGIYFPTDDNLAGFWWRLLARVVDNILIFIVVYMLIPDIIFKIYTNQLANETSTDSMMLRAKFSLIFFGIATLYNTLAEISPMQGSLGKKLCKLIVVDADGRRLGFLQALGRNLGKFVSELVLWVGYLVVLWDTHKQAWHDQWAKTYVIIRNK